MKKSIFGGLVAAVLTLGALAAPSVSAELKSLRGDVGVDQPDQAPEVFQVEEGAKYGRTFRSQPPMIPHKIDKYEIDLKVNQCLRCHDWTNAGKEKAPQIAESHYKDRNGNQQETVVGTRWFCTQCHAPQTNAKPLVDNTFEARR